MEHHVQSTRSINFMIAVAYFNVLSLLCLCYQYFQNQGMFKIKKLICLKMDLNVPKTC